MFKLIKRNRILYFLSIMLGMVIIIFLYYVSFNSNNGNNNGIWEYKYGNWYYKDDFELVKNSWVDNYFVDEHGKMISNEWVYVDESGNYKHAYIVLESDLPQESNILYYVDQNGKKIINKNIYNGLEFDKNGNCIISKEELKLFGNRFEYGLEGLRKFVLINGKYKEYF